MNHAKTMNMLDANYADGIKKEPYCMYFTNVTETNINVELKLKSNTLKIEFKQFYIDFKVKLYT